MPDRREVVAEELRELADDLKQLVTTLTTDPKKQQRREREWAILYGVLSAVATVAARRAAKKAWGILTGELPPGQAPPARERTTA